MFVVKEMFLDRIKILNKAHAAKVRNLTRIGGMIRTTERRIQRYATKRTPTSAPGESPRAHKPGAYLRRFTMFGYDKQSDSVVIGPEKLDRSKTAGGTVPEILEFGGPTLIKEVQLSGGIWRREDLIPPSQRAGRPTRMRQVEIKARPYAAPSLQRNLPKLAGVWANTVRE